MTSTQPNRIRLEPNTRVEYVDAVDWLTLERAYQDFVRSETFKAATPFVWAGFEKVDVLPFDVEIGAGAVFATTATGKAIAKPASTATTLTLPASSTTYIYAYVEDVESTPDARRAYNQFLGAESSVSVNTRFTPTIGYLTSPSSGLTHTTASGQTVELIRLYSVVTDGAGITGSTDLRPWFGTEDAAIAMTGTNGRGISSLHALYSKVVKALRLMRSPTLGWYDQGSVRTVEAIDNEVLDARAAAYTPNNIATDLRTAVEAAIPYGSTAGDPVNNGANANKGQLTNAADFATYLNHATATTLYVKGVKYQNVGNVAITGKTGLVIKGQPSAHTLGVGTDTGQASILSFLPGATQNFTLTSCVGVTIEDVHFDMANAAAGRWSLVLASCRNVLFRGCTFSQGDNLTDALVKLTDATHDVTFERCTFSQGFSQLQPLLWCTGSVTTVRNLAIRDCLYIGNGPFLRVDSFASHLYGDVFVENNVFLTDSSASGKAIQNLVQVFNATIAAPTLRLHVTNNHFLDDDPSAGAQTRAFSMTHDQTGLAQVHAVIEGNTFQGMYEAVAAGVTSGTLSVSGNAYDANGRASNQSVYTLLIPRAGDERTAVVTCANNTAKLDDSGNGIVLKTLNTTAGSDHRASVHIRSNRIAYPALGIEVDVTAGSVGVGTLVVEGNTVERATTSAIHIWGLLTTKMCEVRANVVRAGGSASYTLLVPFVNGSLSDQVVAAIWIESIGAFGFDTLDVCDNVISEWASAFSGAGMAFGVLVRPYFSNSIRVDRNVVSDFYNTTNAGASAADLLGASCLAVILPASGLASVVTLYSMISISNNRVEGGCDGSGVYLDGGSNGNAAAAYRFYVMRSVALHGNSVNLLSSAVSSLGVGLKVGAFFQEADAAGSTYNIKQLSCLGNHVFVNHDVDASIGAAHLDLASGPVSFANDHANITGNTVTTTAGGALFNRSNTKSLIVGNMLNQGSGVQIDANAAGASHVRSGNV